MGLPKPLLRAWDVEANQGLQSNQKTPAQAPHAAGTSAERSDAADTEDKGPATNRRKTCRIVCRRIAQLHLTEAALGCLGCFSWKVSCDYFGEVGDFESRHT